MLDLINEIYLERSFDLKDESCFTEHHISTPSMAAHVRLLPPDRSLVICGFPFPSGQ